MIIIGAGAAGLFCGAQAGKHDKKIRILDHAKKLCEKIRIAGGGKCNFTNLHCGPENFISSNPHFCKSALKQYSQFDFIELVKSYNIAYHEKTLGQLFCEDSSQQIIDLLLAECNRANIKIQKETNITHISYDRQSALYHVQTDQETYCAPSLVIATGGLSIPKIGASKFGYDIARQFNIPVIETKAALVPLVFQAQIKEDCKSLSGVSTDAIITTHDKKTQFREGMLFTHRGLSGPSILQISSYWNEGEPVIINLHPDQDMYEYLIKQKQQNPKKNIATILSTLLPSRLVDMILSEITDNQRIAEMNNKTLSAIANRINHWAIKPSGTEGYRTAEVTLGGVDTNALHSKTMECKNQPGLYFIGEVVDVTGHLGGHNFQWAWSSGYVAGQNV